MKVKDRLRRPGVWALILLTAFAGAPRAAAPNLLTYQGRLKESGLPVTGTRNVDIQLCPALTGGVCVDTGVQNNVPVSNGLFHVVFAVPSGVSLESGSWYLEVQVNGSAFTPREPLSSSAYAVYASSASALIAAPGSSYVTVSTPMAVSAQDAAGYSVLLSSGLSTPFGTISAKYFVGNGSALTGISSIDSTKVAKTGDSMTGSLNLIGANLNVTGVGVVAVGSSVTAGAFFGDGSHLSGVTAPGAVAKTGDAMTGQLTLANGSSATVTGAVGIGGTSLGGGTLVVLSTSATAANPVADFRDNAGTSLMQIQQGGAVGIGTAPVAGTPLTVQTNAGANGIKVTNGTSGIYLSVNSGVSGNPYMYFSNGVLSYIQNLLPSGNFAIGDYSGPLAFEMEPGVNQRAIYIKAPGKVGIGTAAPGALLDVAGNAAFSGPVTLSGSTLTVTGTGFSVGGSTFVVAGGQVGIGTSALPTGAYLQVNTTADGAFDRIAIQGPDNTTQQGFEISQPARKWQIGQNLGNFGDGRLQVYDATLGVYRADFLGSGDVNIGGPDAQTNPGLVVSPNGWVSFGVGGVKSSLSALGSVFLANGSSITLSGSAGVIATQSSVTASAFYGDGSHLSGITATGGVAKSGDFMTGPLTMTGGSTITVSGSQFSVGGSSFVVSGSSVGVGTASPAAALHVVGAAGNSSALFEGPTLSQISIRSTAVTEQNVGVSFEGWSNSQAGMRQLGQARAIPGGHMTFETTGDGAVSSTERMRIEAFGNVGIGTPSPGALLDVGGSAQFGGAGSKSAFSAAGGLTMAAGAPISLSGPLGFVTTQSSVTASAFFGDGSHLTGVVSPSAVAKTGDTMTGALLLSGSTLTVNGPLFATGTMGDILYTGAGTRFMWVPSSGAIRAGYALSTEWNPGQVGAYSVAFGYNNIASAENSTVGGGKSNAAITQYATVGGGFGNSANSTFATVAGGQNNAASYGAFVGGGTNNSASNFYAAVPGGLGNNAAGQYSFAAGNAASANKDGSFVWADASGGGFASDVPNQFRVRALGGFDVRSSSYVFATSVSTLVYIQNNGDVSIGVNPSTFSSSGLAMAAGSSITLSGAAGVIVTQSSITAGVYYGDGSHLTNLVVPDGTKVAKTGDTMTGQLTISNSSLTVVGNAGASPLTVSTSAVPGSVGLYVDANNKVGVGTTAPIGQLHVTGSANTSIGITAPTNALAELDLYDTPGIQWSLARWFTSNDLRIRAGGTLDYLTILRSNGNVGLGTTAPGTTLDVAGNAQFGTTAKSSFTTTGALLMAKDAGLSLTGANGIIVTQSSVTAGVYYGDGSHLTGLVVPDPTKVAKTGDTMTGQLTLDGSTLTVTGNAFAVGGSTFIVSGGSVGIGGYNSAAMLSVNGRLLAGGVATDGYSVLPGQLATTQVLLGGNNALGYTGVGGLGIIHGDGGAGAWVHQDFYVGGQAFPMFRMNTSGAAIGGAYPIANRLDINGGGIGLGSYAGIYTAPSGGIIMSGALGAGNVAPAAAVHVSSGDVLMDGDSGAASVSGPGKRFEWIVSSAAIRAGYVTGTQWDPANIGLQSVAFGYSPTASGPYSFVGGGQFNNASGSRAVIAGGDSNLASSNAAAVGGGTSNQATGTNAAVAGGTGNLAQGTSSVVAGGSSNNASNSNTAIGGGNNNSAAGGYATVPGGNSNQANGLYSFAAGNGAIAGTSGVFAWADSQGGTFLVNSTDRFGIRAQGGFGVYGTNAVPTFTLDSAGKVGISTGIPTYDLSLGFGQKTLGVEDGPVEGSTITIRSGTGITGSGGDIVLKGGNGSGGGAWGGSVALIPGIGPTAPGYVSIVGANAGAAHLKVTQFAMGSVTPNCGTSPSVTGAGGLTDMAGSFTLTSGSGVGTCSIVLTFNKAYANPGNLRVIVGANNPAAATCQPYAFPSAAPNSGSFTIQCNVVPPASTPLSFSYLVIE